MALIRLKGLIVSMLVVLYFTTLAIAALISVTTLVQTGTYLSSFEIFTVLLGIMTLRSTFCYNLGIAVQMVADAKVAVDRMQTFLTKKASKFEVTSGRNRTNQLSTRHLILERAIRSKTNDMAVQLTSFRKLDDPAVEIFQKHTFNSATSTRKPIQFSNILSEVPLKTSADQVNTELITSEQTSGSSYKEPYLSISDASCSWNEAHHTETLSDITFNVRSGDMLAVTGAVGCGKSSLLTCLLEELPLCKGAISYHGKVAYVPQIPWVFSGTIRENILFGLPFSHQKLQRVVEVCGLTKDLKDFSNGDLTEIGQRGVTLSGGQKARVGLARAVYSDVDIYLLDDTLSAVDAKVGSKLFQSCILDHLSSRIRLLVTHQLQYLKDVDRIAVMEKGSIIHLGGYTQLKDQGAFKGLLELSENFTIDDSELAQSESGDEYNVAKTTKNVTHEPSNASASFMKQTQGRENEAFVDDPELPKPQEDNNIGNVYNTDETTVQLTGSPVPASTCDVSEGNRPPFLDLKKIQESKTAGAVTWRLYWDYFKQGLPVPFIMLLTMFLALEQGNTS